MRFLPLSQSLAIGLGGLAALAGAVVVARDAAGNAFARSRPDLALRAVPDHPIALAHRIDDTLIATGAVGGPQSPEARAVATALRQEPLSADLIRQLAMMRSLKGNTANSRLLMALAERTSRRDLPTQIWMIEAAVADGNINRALSHYDLALTTSRRAPALLFPVLIGALGNPEIRAELARYLRWHRPWSDVFLTQAVATGQPRDVAALVAEVASARNDPAFRAVQASLIGAFVVHKDYPGLNSYAGTLPSADQASIRSIGFSQSTVDRRLRPLTWELTDDPDLGAGYDEGDRLRISARGGTGGIVARRIIFRQPGTWRLRQTITPGADSSGLDVRWEGYCLDSSGQQSFWSQTMPHQATTVQANIAIPEGCRTIELRILASADMDSASALILTLAGVSLVRIG
ncbi:hypothetical protein KCP91_18955 [Microvirga sp. SRT01]|uniref:Uncharacterized protein n=1 Tax=Sphingomonas longa TaxID=2778730 RepID=A0ABS2DBZ3_9SPHN|nr:MULTISPECIES: hypothetical protein [Alphaproteobacteria]MBM6578468.1 hypothetical protein [Sphingomonas sp. BT552]MBR7711508.1 hypothetical protein [Microvirga sp. SRT01]